MAGELWRELLPLLRAGDLVAWNQVIEGSYDPVYKALLTQARNRNSSLGGRLPDPEVQDLARILTNEAFLIAMRRVAEFDPLVSPLPTWVYWLGRARCKGLLDPLLRQERDRAAQESFDGAGGEALASAPSAEAEAVAGLEQAESRARIAAILRAMRSEWATAIVQVQLVREEGHPYPIQVAADRSGRSVEAMDSLLRRATRDFKARWGQAYGSGPVTPAE